MKPVISDFNRFCVLIIMMVIAACAPLGSPQFSPTPTRPIPTPTQMPTPFPPSASAGLFPDYSVVLSTDGKRWVVENNDNEAVATWNPGQRLWVYHYRVLAHDERISVFDATSFPPKYEQIAQSWLEATDAEWDAYQAFVEAARDEFFLRGGIEEEVAAIEDINPDLKSLWGMIYWAQENRDRVIEEQLMPVVTPKEIRIIMEGFPNLPYSNRRYDEFIVLPDGTTTYAGWGFDFFKSHGETWYNSSQVGEIIGRDDIVINHEPVYTVFGDLALLARLFPDKSDPVLVLTHLKLSPENRQPYGHVLFAQMATFDETYTLPQGTICSAWDTTSIPSDCQGCRGTERKFELPVDYFILPLEIATSRKLVMLNDLFSKLGDGIGFEPPLMRYGGPWVIDGVVPGQCLDPNLGMEIAGRTGRTDQPISLYPYAWPWQGQPPVHAWEFEQHSEGKTEGWEISGADLRLEQGDLIIESPGFGNGAVVSPELSIDADMYSKVQIRMRVSGGNEAELSYRPELQTGFNTMQHTRFDIYPDGFFHTYTIDFSEDPNWSGEIKQLKLTPSDLISVIEIEYIHLVGAYDFEFENEGETEGWAPFSNYDGFRVAVLKNQAWGTFINPTMASKQPWGSLVFESTGTDPAILSPLLSIQAQEYSKIQLGMRVSCGTRGQLFFATDVDPNFDDEKAITFPIENWSTYQIYNLDMASLPSWDGNITQIRLDPVQCRGTVEIDFVRFLTNAE